MSVIDDRQSIPKMGFTLYSVGNYQPCAGISKIS